MLKITPDQRYVHAVVVHRHDVHKIHVVVRGHRGSITVDIDAMDCDLRFVVERTEDHVDLGRCHEFLAGHFVECQAVSDDGFE